MNRDGAGYDEFYFSRFCKETIAPGCSSSLIRWFYFSRFCKETIASAADISIRAGFILADFVRKL